ncbi:hypothetical protein [Vibrio owensii]|uniref:Uncharacterized protein n=1 Tax=Vibrio owensii CAIM 1854 = LMG 25443 TaxID=1229493 RepID=A0A0C1YMX5_9VIBR|nr:hypothetical protein [Vibrio owensii]KIF45444.1 hypothetical protein H735_29675 [Vibrio owensii CAIM 1854 = LMG 25443]
MATKTIIVRNFGSFYDVCDNELVYGHNVHCTFYVAPNETKSMEALLQEKGGVKLTTSTKNYFQKIGINI